MPTLVITPKVTSTPEEKQHNREIIERYLPGLPEFYMEVRAAFNAKLGSIEIKISDVDMPWIRERMDETKIIK